MRNAQKEEKILVCFSSCVFSLSIQVGSQIQTLQIEGLIKETELLIINVKITERKTYMCGPLCLQYPVITTSRY
jgi:hypothetical protein